MFYFRERQGVKRLLIVQKYGGTSVGSIERIQAVALRIKKTVEDGNQVVVVVSAMGHSTDELLALANQLTDSPDMRELDALLSTGEQVSAALVAMALQQHQLASQSFTGWQAGIRTEAVHGAARMTEIDAQALRTAVKRGIIPVITGFQGIAGEHVTTLGRGGSDTTAVAVAAALCADVCEIYTDVAGVYTTDPRVVATARKLNAISYDEMLELATLGAQVLHPRAVENAKYFGVKLKVRSSFIEEEGTNVVEAPMGLEMRNVVTGVAFERDVARVALIGVPQKEHGLAVVFGELAERGVNVDVIVQSVVAQVDVDVSFTVKASDLPRAVQILSELKRTLQFSRLVQETGLGKVSIVGAGMISNPGVAAEMFRVLAKANISIKMVSTSEIKVSCIVENADVNAAVEVLHQAFVDA